jgi:diguanylate cyclase
MDVRPDTFAKALETAKTALAVMAENGIPPTPRNYAVWYAHVGRAAPELSRALDAMIAAQEPFTSERNDELFVRFIAAEAQATSMAEVGRRLHKSIGKVLETLTKASGDTKAYGDRLDAVSAELDSEHGIERLRDIIDGLAAETQRVASQNQTLEIQLVKSSSEIADLRRSLAVVQHEAMTDSLTGIHNRKFFDIRLSEAVREAQESGEELTLLVIDIDHFKRFNDTWGHQLGDQVLRLVARTLTDSVKGRDVTARFGGEEFAIILEKTRLEDAVRIADQIRLTMMRRRIVKKDSGDDLGGVTVSIGVSRYRRGEPATGFLERADAALYTAKNAGRNRVAPESEGDRVQAAVA